ncbi:ROK family protein [Streptomyces avermitilis]|uniref:ROK family protein n=1 Tax=Streptomyces avermitilis TaxID=33903 RepID=UPI00340B942A
MALLPAGSALIGPAHSRSEKVQRDLLAAVITAEGPISRKKYAEATAEPMPTVLRAAKNLLAAGLIVQGDDLPLDGPGRPERALKINPHHVYLGLAIEDRSPETGTNVGWQVCALGVTLDGKPLVGLPAEYEPIESPYGLDQVVVAVSKVVERIRDKIPHQSAQVHGLGVSVGGHVEDGTVRFSPNITGLRDERLAERIEAATRLPTLVQNDANALARRLFWQKGGREMSFAVVLVKPDGIGAGTVKDGSVYVGATGMSGELGHFKMYPPEELRRQCRCGGYGCLETLATPQAIALGLGLQEVKWHEAIDRAEKGDAAAEKAFREAGDFLGRALATLVATVDPEKVYLLWENESLDPAQHRAAELYLQGARDALERDLFPTAFGQRLVSAALPTSEDQAQAAASGPIEKLVEKQPENGNEKPDNGSPEGA